MNKCSIIFLRHGGSEPLDKDGCLLNQDNHDTHVFKDEDGKYIAWKDDDTCNCGCWDTDDYSTVCKLYREISESEFLKLKKQKH